MLYSKVENVIHNYNKSSTFQYELCLEINERLHVNFRSSYPQVSLGNCVLKICCKFTGENPCRSAISIKLRSNFIEITLRRGRSPGNLQHIFRTPFLKNISEWLLLKRESLKTYKKCPCILAVSTEPRKNIFVLTEEIRDIKKSYRKERSWTVWIGSLYFQIYAIYAVYEISRFKQTCKRTRM